MNEILVGIKYCGGCNPSYDRPSLVNKLGNDLRGIAKFEAATPKLLYDVILIVCGCQRRCASTRDLSVKYKMIYLIGNNDYPLALNFIKKCNNTKIIIPER